MLEIEKKKYIDSAFCWCSYLLSEASYFRLGSSTELIVHDNNALRLYANRKLSSGLVCS